MNQNRRAAILAAVRVELLQIAGAPLCEIARERVSMARHAIAGGIPPAELWPGCPNTGLSGREVWEIYIEECEKWMGPPTDE